MLVGGGLLAAVSVLRAPVLLAPAVVVTVVGALQVVQKTAVTSSTSARPPSSPS